MQGMFSGSEWHLTCGCAGCRECTGGWGTPERLSGAPWPAMVSMWCWPPCLSSLLTGAAAELPLATVASQVSATSAAMRAILAHNSMHGLSNVPRGQKGLS